MSAPIRGCLIASPSQNRGTAATVAWTLGTADALYPVANVITLEPDVPAKVTAAGDATLQATLPGAESLEGVVLINTNVGARTVDLTNNAGMATQSQAVMNPEDGLCVNAWWDLRGVANTTASIWTVHINDAVTPVAIGTLLLITAWHHLRIRWDWELREKFPRIEHRTGHGKRLQYQIPVRTRSYQALPFEAADRDELRTLRREAHGSIEPWTLVPDMDDQDVLLVQFLEEEHRETYRFVRGVFVDMTADGVVDQPIAVEEVNAGVALA